MINGHAAAAAALLEAGADVRARDRAGETPLEMAERRARCGAGEPPRSCTVHPGRSLGLCGSNQSAHSDGMALSFGAREGREREREWEGRRVRVA